MFLLRIAVLQRELHLVLDHLISVAFEPKGIIILLVFMRVRAAVFFIEDLSLGFEGKFLLFKLLESLRNFVVVARILSLSELGCERRLFLERRTKERELDLRKA